MVQTPGSQIWQPEGVRTAHTEVQQGHTQGNQYNQRGMVPKLISLKAVLLSGLENMSQKSTGPCPVEELISEELRRRWLYLTPSEYGPTATLARHIGGNKQCCSDAVTVTVHRGGSQAHKEMDVHHLCTQSIIFPVYDPFIVIVACSSSWTRTFLN